jgi:CRISPR/Cas system-associated exonuclease Cas4 (RecB family)
MVEHDFSVPITDPSTGKPMRAIDSRIMPEDWEPKTEGQYRAAMQGGLLAKVGYNKPVHARGRMDLIVQDLESGQYGIMDHKTASRVDDDYFRHLTLDDQVTTYAWAAEREAELHDLEYKKIDFVIYQALRKAYPRPPTELKSGMPSVDKAKESTTPQLFEAFIKEHNLQVVFDQSASLQGYYAYLLEMGERQFISRETVKRNKFQKAALGSRLFYEASDMLEVVDKPERHYPSPSKDWGCLNCQFRSPCTAKEQGYDYESMLADGYVSNYDR